ncbi:MAG TPA: vWA domain-containing protein, partial [Candidatus Acidoferrum sp.]|nr:vWA domain-containing protein [Candidatus Acidoferrum sp.]
GMWRAFHLTPTITYTGGITKTITVNATADVPLLFARIFGQPTATVAASAVAVRRDARVMVVIDRSGSMKPGTIMADVKKYAVGFTQRFTKGTDQLGLVVFDGSGVVGYPPVSPWDPNTTSTATGGPDTNFNDGSATDMVNQIQAITADSGTGIADALSLAYIELQKAHMKEVAANGVDLKQNAIVLFTDGAPSALSVYLNNPLNYPANNIISSSSTCTNKVSSAPPPTPPKMLGWISVAGQPGQTVNSLWSFYLLASLNTNSSQTPAWWMSNGGAATAKDFAGWPSPNNQIGCKVPGSGTPGTPSLAGLTAAASTSNLVDLTKIPDMDMYGNSTTGFRYRNSEYVNTAGSIVNPNPVYNATGGELQQNLTTNAYQWGLAMWNAADDAATRILADANRPNRAGDVNPMITTIYTIGYVGNTGLDQGLLKRIANDKSAAGYDPTKRTGIYAPAADTVALANAFDTIASAILRLSR